MSGLGDSLPMDEFNADSLIMGMQMSGPEDGSISGSWRGISPAARNSFDDERFLGHRRASPEGGPPAKMPHDVAQPVRIGPGGASDEVLGMSFSLEGQDDMIAMSFDASGDQPASDL